MSQDVELVIKIPKETLKDIKMLSDYGYNSMFNGLVEAINNGTPLPKGHGRLIDADELLYEDIECIDGNTYMTVNAYSVDNAPTIIEAEREK